MRHQSTTWLIMMFAVLIMLTSCSRNKSNYAEFEEKGMFSQKIKISTLPTTAKILINEQEIGNSPITYIVRHEDRRMLNIKAIPIYPNQYTQNIFLMVPPIPKTMTIYMNHYPEDYDLQQDMPFSPPKKPEPQIITRTDIDTVYFHTVETKRSVLSLPAIYFDTASYRLNQSEISKLDHLSELLNQYPDYELEIYGFADHRASDAYNQELTLNRANSVREYLISKGMNPNNLYTFGHGKVSRITSRGPDTDLQNSRKVLFLLKLPEQE